MKINKIKVCNFRAIKEAQCDIENNALVLVGANNSGKSSFVNGVRTFWGDTEISEDDFHKESDEISIIVKFEVLEDSFSNKYLINNGKVGLLKIPSTISEFKESTKDTSLIDMTFNDYKKYREDAYENDLEEELILCIDIWKKSIYSRLNIINDTCKIECKMSKDNKKGKYYNSQGEEVRDFIEYINKIAFIDDDRNFTEEGEGKTKSLTSKILGDHIMGSKDDECIDCTLINCSDCIDRINEKTVRDLDMNDLEKLVNSKARELSSDISDGISKIFQSNFNDDYEILLNTSSNVNKSFTISTKIYLPQLKKHVDLSNVGAGVRSIYILSLLQAYLELEELSDNIFIIEEPEIYLHPKLQKVMASILYDISKENFIIITTHSPIIVNKFELDSIRKVRLNENYETVLQESSLSEVLQDLGYSTSDILFTEYVIIVEGKDDKKWIEKIIETYYDVDIDKFYIIHAKSCTSIEAYATLRFLGKTNLTDNFLIIRDSDTRDLAVVKEDILNKYGENVEEEILESISDKIHILNYSSFDNYFLVPERLEEIGVVKDQETYYKRISGHIKNNKQGIKKYIYGNNKKDEERADEIYQLIYDDRDIEDKIEDVKKYVRGHDLFGQFQILIDKTEDFIEKSKLEDFEEIINHLDKLEYLKRNKKYKE